MTHPMDSVPMPEPFGWCTPNHAHDHTLYHGAPHEPAKYTYKNKQISLYTAEQLRSYGLSAYEMGRNAGLEEAAAEFDRRGRGNMASGTGAPGWYEPEEPAEIVRSLKR